MLRGELYMMEPGEQRQLANRLCMWIGRRVGVNWRHLQCQVRNRGGEGSCYMVMLALDKSVCDKVMRGWEAAGSLTFTRFGKVTELRVRFVKGVEEGSSKGFAQVEKVPRIKWRKGPGGGGGGGGGYQ